MRYLLEPYTRSKNKIKVKLDLSNYATTPDLKSPAGNTDLVTLKSKMDELKFGKIETSPVDLRKLSDAV